MENDNYVNQQIMAYEALLDQNYDDVPDDWDMYEDMSALKQSFRAGGTAELAFNQHHLPAQPETQSVEAPKAGEEFSDEWFDERY